MSNQQLDETIPNNTNLTVVRKASDVLLELETKIDVLLGIVKSQELNMRVLSNKLNSLMEKINSQPTYAAPIPSPFKVETTQAPTSPLTQLPKNNEFSIQVAHNPESFQRHSRPETYEGDNAYLTRPNKAPQVANQQQYPVQILKPPTAHTSQQENAIVKVPPQAFQKSEIIPVDPIPSAPAGYRNTVPIQQRVVDNRGNSIFLANVEITDHQTNNSVFKGKTSANGKWMAALPEGNYRVVIKKMDASKKNVEITQDIRVEEKNSPLDLPMIAIK